MKIALTCRRESNTGKIDDYRLDTLYRVKYLVVYDSGTNKIKVYELTGFENVERDNKGPALADYITEKLGKIDVLGTPDHKLQIDGGDAWEENAVAGTVNDNAKDVMETLIKKYKGVVE